MTRYFVDEDGIIWPVYGEGENTRSPFVDMYPEDIKILLDHRLAGWTEIIFVRGDKSSDPGEHLHEYVLHDSLTALAKEIEGT